MYNKYPQFVIVAILHVHVLSLSKSYYSDWNTTAGNAYMHMQSVSATENRLDERYSYAFRAWCTVIVKVAVNEWGVLCWVCFRYCHAACREGQFRCHNTGRCIPSYQTCDGVDTCGDLSDELLNCSEWRKLIRLFMIYHYKDGATTVRSTRL